SNARCTRAHRYDSRARRSQTRRDLRGARARASEMCTHPSPRPPPAPRSRPVFTIGGSLHILTSMAGQRMTPQGEAIFLVLWGVGSGLVGWFFLRNAAAIATAAGPTRHARRGAATHR